MSLVPDSLLRVDASGTVLDYQPSQETELAVPVEKVVGKRLTEILPGRLGQEAMEHLQQALATGDNRVWTTELPINSLVREIEVRVSPCGPEEVVAIVRDITDRHRLEKEILEISHREQQRIGQDLHDSLGQHLTGISFLSKALQNKLKAQKIPEEGLADEISQLVIQTLGHTRNIARGLFPMELESTGRLIPALQELVANTEKLFRVTCRLEVDPGVEICEARVSTELFRIAQEAISNAIKHGKAKRVCVRLQSGPAQLRLMIQDDGTGIPAGKPTSGLGLRIMNFRANRIGGKLEIQPLELGGTLVQCDFAAPNPGSNSNSNSTAHSLPHTH